MQDRAAAALRSQQDLERREAEEAAKVPTQSEWAQRVKNDRNIDYENAIRAKMPEIIKNLRSTFGSRITPNEINRMAYEDAKQLVDQERRSSGSSSSGSPSPPRSGPAAPAPAARPAPSRPAPAPTSPASASGSSSTDAMMRGLSPAQEIMVHQMVFGETNMTWEDAIAFVKGQ
jgi:hypothetical protein